MIASTWLDPVLGIDIHWEFVPMPAPVPIPFPHPFIGIVFDPGGLIGAMVMNAAMSLVFGAPFKGPVIHWFLPATNTGTNAKHVPGHFIIPPGTMWAPVPRTPKPKIRPNEIAAPAPPVMPENDAICVFGSKTVTVGGSNAVRLGDLLMSCSEPIRLPSSVVLAIPKGAPILIGGPPSLDLMAAVMASLRTRFVSDSLHALVSRLAPGRFRNLLDRAICFLTGHPVDVATGMVMTWASDAALPGPLPLRIERVYSSAFGDRDGPLGHGWSLSVDQAVWSERGKMVLLAEDGRELEFDTFHLPEHRMRPGTEVWNPLDRLTLRALEGDRWQVEGVEGIVREFAPVPGRKDGRARLQRLRSRCGNHEILFGYDGLGRLDKIRDASGRVLALEWDARGHLTSLALPAADGPGWQPHRRFTYGPEGDLTQVTDSLGHSWRFQYVDHLLVRETDRAGLSFFFEYDGLGQDAWCTRTWGDGGIFDHRLAYDKTKRITFVTDSLGHTTQFHMNLLGMVVKVVDPLQAETTYAYHPQTFQLIRQVGPAGDVSTWRHDPQGRELEITGPDGGQLQLQHGPTGLERATDPGGAAWTWTRDPHGLLTRVLTPAGEAIEIGYLRGLPVRVRSGPREVHATYDAQNDLVALQAENGSATHYQYDRRGRVRVVEDACGGVARLHYDPEGRTTRVETASGVIEELEWSPDGDLLAFRDATHQIRYQIGNMHRIVSREDGGATERLEYDTEGRVTAAVNAAGERFTLERNEAGQVVREVGFDGVARRYRRDRAGRIVEVSWPSGRRTKVGYDAAGRMLRMDHSDGTGAELKYDRNGAMIGASTRSSQVEFSRDAMRRPVEELQVVGGERFTVASRFGPDGLRSGLVSSRGAAEAWSRGTFGLVVSVALGTDAAWQGVSELLAPRLKARLDRDPLGRTSALEWSSGVRLDWTRDRAGRPVKQRVKSGPREEQTREYSWSGQDRLDAVSEAGRGQTRFQHDSRRRLVGVLQPDGGRTARAFDAAGNVYGRDDRADRRYGPGGRLTSAGETTFEYDADGWMSARRGPAGEWRYAWNGDGLLSQVDGPEGQRICFEYDAFARRVRKSVWSGPGPHADPADDVRYFWDGDRLLHEASVRRGLVTWYWGGDGLVPIAREVNGRRWTLIPDHLGTPVAMHDSSGALVWAGQLDAMGQIEVLLGAAEDCPWRWRGQYHDVETGLHYNRHRYYDPSLGLYLSPDPTGLAGGLAAYAYVGDPLVQVDPFGLHVIEALLNGVAVNNPAARSHSTWWRNLTNSAENGMAASGFGRLGDSENRLMEYLQQAYGKEGLQGKTLEIFSLGEPGMGWGPLHPCDHCGPGMQNFANEMEMTVIYHGPEGTEPRRYEPCKK